ncbi:MAG: hypothetical protein OEM96_05010, partial [Gemmatimonadota bacterium]|nr:hypothetical protein [Gemmatimonadota bacterium]
MPGGTGVRALLVAVGALALPGACGDGSEEVAGPPIPTLAAAGDGSETTELADGALNSTCACEVWSCAWGDCGY